MTDPHNLRRFLDAQAKTYAQALEEVRRGAKTSHWMWFIFPQIAGLGSSPTARHYALSGIDEAKAYLAHRSLGPRLREITEVLQTLLVADVAQVFGGVDALKLRSSLTLFARAAGSDNVFRQALDRWFGGVEDAATVERING